MVGVAGPKFCGKTWASMAHAESISRIDDRAVREIVEIQPELAFEGKRPHVIDEWQDVPRIWDAARSTPTPSPRSPQRMPISGRFGRGFCRIPSSSRTGTSQRSRPGGTRPSRPAPACARSPSGRLPTPSLPASLLGMTPERLLLERQLLGNLFEELCLHDIRVYASVLGAIPDPGVYYYADADRLEVDAVVELPDGRWGALEIKLNEGKVPDGTDNLMRLRDKVLVNPAAKGREPSFLAVLVGKANYCRTTPEGVFVVPVTCLGA